MASAFFVPPTMAPRLNLLFPHYHCRKGMPSKPRALNALENRHRAAQASYNLSMSQEVIVSNDKPINAYISNASEEENADDEVRRLNKEMEVQSHVSDSTVTVDIDRVSNDSKKIDTEGRPAS